MKMEHILWSCSRRAEVATSWRDFRVSICGIFIHRSLCCLGCRVTCWHERFNYFWLDWCTFVSMDFTQTEGYVPGASLKGQSADQLNNTNFL